MKKVLILWSSAAVLMAFSARGQSFVNLNFESAQIIPVSTNAGGTVSIATANAMPGWNALLGTNQVSVIAYDTPPTVIAPPVGLLGGSAAPAIDGNFDVQLIDAGSITQTGLVPANAQSLSFDVAFGNSMPFIVSLNGQDLSYSALSIGTNSHGLSYTVYGANISGFAGQVETLDFSAFTGHGGGGILDDIQFSTMTVPEPSTISLFCLSGGMLIHARRRFRPRRATFVPRRTGFTSRIARWRE